MTGAWTVLSPTIASWQKDSLPVLDDKIAKLTAARPRDAVDNLVLRHARKIRADMQKLFRAEKELSNVIAAFRARQLEIANKSKPPLTVANAKSVQTEFAWRWLELEGAVLGLAVTTDNAYRAYPNEADAYAAEAAVMKVFLAKTGSRPPKR